MAILNIGSFGTKLTVVLSIGSVSLFADSVDFLNHAAVNFAILRW